ncbi:MAG TPA: hydroxyacid dehydrogenase [Streptomyces sp.]|uniref:hydroxyacid dehydrogenase n=1 Tax=Streptomyces sp. TaxID=1931 RepID=UPI002BECDF92|nr:hydroxyacid dehydrogenase [Streptomyces sp.]HWU10181.1 hydroxyacid dehydrogenase [Streptomyces sp.]
MNLPPLSAHTPARILVVDPIAPSALEQLRNNYDVTVRMQPPEHELGTLLKEADAIVLRSGVKLPGHLIAAASGLRVIARAGNGTDNIDLSAAREAGVQVFNIPSVSSSAVAELALGLAFAVARNIALADREVRGNIWRKAELAGSELSGKTMGIVGLGSIGTKLAALASGIGMRVVASVNRHSDDRQEQCRRLGIELQSTTDVLRQADVVVLACPLNDHTRQLIDAQALRHMKPTAYLVNVARGGVIDEGALHTALSDGTIAGAALDVLATERQPSRLADLNNVVLTPHIGAMTHDSQDRIGQLLLNGLQLALAGQDAPTRVC